MRKFFLFLLTFLWGNLFLWGQSGQEIALADHISAQSAILMDFDNGRILYEREGDTAIPPASMTKIMTLYLAYDAIREGRLEKDQIITIDMNGSAFSRPPGSSLMLLEEGQEVSVFTLMQGLAVSSGNDAAYALAGLIGPGVDAFVEQMNFKAAELGLKDTVFVDPDGWSEYNLVTAEEFALLARHYIQDYPEALEELHSVPFLVYPLPQNMPEGREFRIKVPRKKMNTNRLLGSYEGIDGLKTGYIDESGFNFSATARREESRLISVLMGIHTESYFQGIVLRADESATLLDYGFEHYSPVELTRPALPAIRVWMGSETSLEPLFPESVSALLADGERGAVYSLVTLNENITAPIASTDVIGRVRYYIGSDEIEVADIQAGKDIPRGNFFQQLRDRIILKWRELKSRFL